MLSLNKMQNDEINNACEQIYNAIQTCQKYINIKRTGLAMIFISKYAAEKIDIDLKVCDAYAIQHNKMKNITSPVVISQLEGHAANFPQNLVPVIVQTMLPNEFQNNFGPEFGKDYSYVIHVNLFEV